MAILDLRILPPLAFARLGSGSQPVDNYVLEDNPERPLDFRTIRPAETLYVDETTGEITRKAIPSKIEFLEGEKIKPVAPFLEVFAVTGEDMLVPLTVDLLSQDGLAPKDVQWSIHVANRKVVRRTANPDDQVDGKTGWFSDHDPHTLQGFCRNFLEGRFIDFGSVRYIKPNETFPEIRLRFMPAKGLIYGPEPGSDADENRKNAFLGELAIYRRTGGWAGFEVSSDPALPQGNETLPPALFAIHPPAPPWLHNNEATSRGYLDDACDGLISVQIRLQDGTVLTASARISAGPPAVVPDSFFVRSLADDLDQVLLGPTVPADEPIAITRARAEDIIRRAYETVRFMNVVVMNGNAFKGRPALLLDSMPEEEAADTERALRPVMPPATVDTKAILNLHEQVFAALRGGAAPWFVRLLRRPEEAADYSDYGRRKMPALMCGADNNYLALTYRQISTIERVADASVFLPATTAATPQPAGLTPRNRSAQLHYRALGNPVSTQPEAAVANCCPGLEVDFRAVWRRLFTGIVLREYDNLVMDIDRGVTDPRITALKGHRLLRVNDKDMMGQIKGPSSSDIEAAIVLTTSFNPEGLAPLEWSNALARILFESQGQMVNCYFSREPAWDRQVAYKEGDAILIPMKVRHFFEESTAVISKDLAEPGELTQGLCSPWQNDYRECSCYYWASARPDFVNVEYGADGLSQGDNWFQKKRTGNYVADDYADSRLILYDELFEQWEKWVRIQVGGRDLPQAAGR
jgi:hypothetical protein